jgi:ElaB/YqjD/DUF883 family membrane-anchored ribosome-binding protein
MANDNHSQMQVDLLRAILREISQTRTLLESLVKSNLKESKQNAKEAREHRRKMLLEARKLLETPNKDAMILEELKKRGLK